MLILRGKVYHLRLKFKGRLYQKSLHTGNRNLAITLEAAFRTSLVKNEFGIATTSKVTLITFKDRFISALTTKVKPNSLTYYAQYYDTLTDFPQMGSARLDRIDASLIESFVHVRSQQVKPATVNHSLRVLRRALKLAQEWKVIQAVPKIKMLSGERQREFVVSEATLDMIVSRIPKRSIVKYMVPFLLDTGLRLSEALNLRAEHVRFEPDVGFKFGWVFVEQGKSKWARRYVPLTERAKECLQKVRQEYSLGRDYFFTSGKRNMRRMTRQNPSVVFRKVRDKLGLPWDACIHSLRHSFCTNLAMSGATASEIQKLAGHSSILISQRYTHMTSKSVENAIERMESTRKEQAELEKKRYEEKYPAGVIQEI